MYSIIPKKMCIESTDVDLHLVHEPLSRNDYEADDFDFIPSNEVVNIDVPVEERWLEDNPRLNMELNDDLSIFRVNQNSTHKESVPCGPLETFVLQIKFRDKSG